MRQSQEDSVSDFEDLVLRTYDPLRRYLLRRADEAAAEDVLGDVLLTMWRRAADVPRGEPLPWCYGIARRCLANSRRGAQRHQRLVNKLADQRTGLAPEPRDERVVAALGFLSDTDREVVRLWAWEQLRPEEIAAVLGVSSNAVSIRLHRSIKRIRSAMLPSAPAAQPNSRLTEVIRRERE